MAPQLLIYQTAVPVTRGRHGNWNVETAPNYAFSKQINSVPLMAVEFAQATADYAIVFAGADGEYLPAVILGVRSDENLFVDENGTWAASYVPAFVRRYPFVFSQSAGQFMLCIDEAFRGFNQEGRGQRLFDEDGKPSGYVDGILKFLREYQAQFQRTQQFCARLRELDLLEPMQAQVTTDAGRKLSLSGFMAVNRTKLKDLPAATLAELVKFDELELIYLHLHSMRNFDRLRDRLVQAAATALAAMPVGETNGSAQVH
ncbi:MAG TPA: SapC family protein [Rhodopila sp.]|jgi:hypothetical protein